MMYAPFVALSILTLAGAALVAPVTGPTLALAQPPAIDAPVAKPKAKPINDVCPIMGEPIEEGAMTTEYKGHTIAYCCPMCDAKWKKLSEGEKDAFVARFVKNAATADSPAAKVATSVGQAMAKGDTKALDALFLDAGRATVMADGRDHGTWESFKSGGVREIVTALKSGMVTWDSPVVQGTGTATIVKLTGTAPPGKGGANMSLGIAITLVLTDEGGKPKIAHMHWSSRAK